MISVQDQVIAALYELKLERNRVRFLLGTDEFIAHEARVALVPDQIARLRRDLGQLGIEVETTVVAGAGERARPAFRDDYYRAVGAEITSAEAVARLAPFDVVHALKEPTAYEATLQPDVLRIGALHLASKPPGLAAMVRARNFAAIFDGATVGSCSYLLSQGDRTPIVGSMSRFAGAVAARKAVEALETRGLEPGKVVVVGGGIAGQSAISKLKAWARPLIVIEPWAVNQERLRQTLPKLGIESFEILPRLGDDTLDDAVAIVFAHRTGAKAAEKVCNLEQIRRMRPGAAISDIAIDQGGSIAHAGYGETDDAATAREKYIELFGKEFSYYAEVNMPREEPHEASISHGDSSLPYVTALLGLCAHLGSAAAVARQILSRSIRRDFDSASVQHLTFLEAILQDLRNGLQLANVGSGVEITDPDVAENENLASWIRSAPA